MRKKRGWSQFEAGARLGVTKSKAAAESKMKRMELGQQEPTASEVVLLAEMFDADLTWLLTGRESEPAPGQTALDAYPPEARSYVATVLEVLRGDNYVAKQIMTSATTAIRAVLGHSAKEDEILSILRDMQRKSVQSEPGHYSPGENDGRSTGDMKGQPHPPPKAVNG